MNKYFRYINPIINKVDQHSKDLIKNNIQQVTSTFNIMAIYLEKYIEIESYDIPYDIKVKFISEIGYNNTPFSPQQARKIVDIISMKNSKKSHRGGGTQNPDSIDNSILRELNTQLQGLRVSAIEESPGPVLTPLSSKKKYAQTLDRAGTKIQEELKKTFNVSRDSIEEPLCLNNLPNKILEYIGFLLPTALQEAIRKIFSKVEEDVKKRSKFLDFNPKNSIDCDWIQLFLFVSSIIPVWGGASNFLIIVKGIIEQNYFLAITTILTTITSVLTSFHVIDIGMIFKLFYYMDSKSYKRQFEIFKKDGEGPDSVNITDQKWDSSPLITQQFQELDKSDSEIRKVLIKHFDGSNVIFDQAIQKYLSKEYLERVRERSKKGAVAANDDGNARIDTNVSDNADASNVDDTAVNTGNADASNVDDTAVNTGNESATDDGKETMNEFTLRPSNILLDELYDWVEDSGSTLIDQEYDTLPFNTEYLADRESKRTTKESYDEVGESPGIRRAAASSGLELARRTEDETAVENFLQGLLAHYTKE